MSERERGNLLGRLAAFVLLLGAVFAVLRLSCGAPLCPFVAPAAPAAPAAAAAAPKPAPTPRAAPRTGR